MNKENKRGYYTYKLSMTVLNVLAIILLIIVGGLVLFLEHSDNYTIMIDLPLLIIIMFFWLLLHELLHGIGFALSRDVDKKNITFGMFLEKGVFYCMCKQNISKKSALVALLFPITIIGIITLIIGMIINSYELVFLSVFNIMSSIGDIVMSIYFLKCPSDITYLDLDDCTSFTVISSNNLDNIKVPGIILDKKGIYNEKEMVAKDKRKLVISPLSYILIFIIVILFIFYIINK